MCVCVCVCVCITTEKSAKLEARSYTTTVVEVCAAPSGCIGKSLYPITRRTPTYILHDALQVRDMIYVATCEHDNVVNIYKYNRVIIMLRD
jgi:hypothetical protein